MTAAAMEQKRISGNPSFKTMIAVPNHLVTSGQFVKEILEAYPSAKVLAATPDSLSGIGRRSFLKKMATGNYDIVVIAHSSFGKIPLNPRFEQEFIQKQINDLEAEVRTARADSDRSYEAELQTMMDNLRDKLAKMSADLKRDELSTYFNELNIDSLFVDEAHEFKNLSFRTRMSRVPGVNPKGSDMAFDMWMKTTYFNKATNEKNLLFATGTPIANAIAEMYTMQRYLQPSELTRLGLEHFDSWAASFADEVTKPEIDPAGGGMRMHSRLSQYINMPELSAIFRQVADVQTADMLVDVLKRPLIKRFSSSN
jgi:N12 class adenine-specific DNA methylase